ncbi:unnamed protein product [Closterium sp. Yama58-4]|nr:unnamed protein product [Closterium sp. Yama58-4]
MANLQPYLDNLKHISDEKITSAAIYCQDGSPRARSESFPAVTDDQIRAIVEGFDNMNVLAANGLWLGNEKFIVIRGEPGSVIRGRNKENLNGKSDGCCIHKTGDGIVIGIYGETSAAGGVTISVATVAKYLKDVGF